MRGFSFTDRGNAANEDFACAGPLPAGGAYGVVIDGATGLAGELNCLPFLGHGN